MNFPVDFSYDRENEGGLLQCGVFRAAAIMASGGGSLFMKEPDRNSVRTADDRDYGSQ